ncbi:Flagellar FliJ protein [Methylophilaceae bacterium]|nr:Flagellar FliJ protein [Methylophilaceae bacterium]
MPAQPPTVMHTLVDLAAKECKRAAEKLSEANQLLKDGQKNLTMLMDYRRDYTQQLSQHLQAGVFTESYQNFQGFLQKLDQAISGQEKVVESCKQKVEVQLKHWQACERKKLSYGVIINHAEARAHLVQLKKDQKLMDEHALRQSMKNMNKVQSR